MKKKNVLRTLGEDERLMAYCYLQLDLLRKSGVIEGGNYMLSKQGRRDIQELVKEGWRPNHEDYVDAMHFILSGGDSPAPRLDS